MLQKNLRPLELAPRLSGEAREYHTNYTSLIERSEDEMEALLANPKASQMDFERYNAKYPFMADKARQAYGIQEGKAKNQVTQSLAGILSSLSDEGDNTRAIERMDEFVKNYDGVQGGFGQMAKDLSGLKSVLGEEGGSVQARNTIRSLLNLNDPKAAIAFAKTQGEFADATGQEITNESLVGGTTEREEFKLRKKELEQELTRTKIAMKSAATREEELKYKRSLMRSPSN